MKQFRFVFAGLATLAALTQAPPARADGGVELDIEVALTGAGQGNDCLHSSLKTGPLAGSCKHQSTAAPTLAPGGSTTLTLPNGHALTISLSADGAQVKAALGGAATAQGSSALKPEIVVWDGAKYNGGNIIVAIGRKK